MRSQLLSAVHDDKTKSILTNLNRSLGAKVKKLPAKERIVILITEIFKHLESNLYIGLFYKLRRILVLMLRHLATIRRAFVSFSG